MKIVPENQFSGKTYFYTIASRLSMKEGLDEFAVLMKSQLDLSVEAKNLSKFRANFSKHPDIVFPKPFLGKGAYQRERERATPLARCQPGFEAPRE